MNGPSPIGETLPATKMHTCSKVILVMRRSAGVLSAIYAKQDMPIAAKVPQQPYRKSPMKK